MVRYCQVCQKEYDFPVKSMKDLDELFCPVCHSPVRLDSRKPIVEEETEQAAHAIGNVYAGVLRFFYLFLVICAGLGLLFYILHMNGPLIAVTIVAMLFGLLRYGNFGLCALFLIGGAVAGFLLGKSVRSTCLGVMVGIVLFCIVRDLIYRLIEALIRAGR